MYSQFCAQLNRDAGSWRQSCVVQFVWFLIDLHNPITKSESGNGISLLKFFLSRAWVFSRWFFLLSSLFFLSQIYFFWNNTSASASYAVRFHNMKWFAILFIYSIMVSSSFLFSFDWNQNCLIWMSSLLQCGNVWLTGISSDNRLYAVCDRKYR